MTSLAQSRQQTIDPATVVGWGVDADPRNDPTYPYRLRAEVVDRAMTWERPMLQETSTEVLSSIEYNHLPAVMGTTRPPRGVSGALRRYAFRYSESNWGHWLTLMAADRVDMVEGLLQDVTRGKLPDIPREMGLRAAWRHDRERLVLKAGALAAAAGLAVLILRHRLKRSAQRHPHRARQPARESMAR